MKEATEDERRSWPAPLYQRLMGTAWTELDEAVRQAHLLHGRLRGVGLFRVQHGTGKLARFLLAVLPLPPAGETVATELVITPLERRERWMRRFGNKTLVTTQTERAGGVLVERLSTVELRFLLEVKDGALIYRQIRAALRFGPLFVPLPAWLWPRVEASEQAEGLDRIRVSVSLTAPFAGFLISYDGHIRIEDSE